MPGALFDFPCVYIVEAEQEPLVNKFILAMSCKAILYCIVLYCVAFDWI